MCDRGPGHTTRHPRPAPAAVRSRPVRPGPWSEEGLVCDRGPGHTTRPPRPLPCGPVRFGRARGSAIVCPAHCGLRIGIAPFM